VRGVLIWIGIAVAIWLVAVIVLIALGRLSQVRELATLIPNQRVLFRDPLLDPVVPRSAELFAASSSDVALVLITSVTR
jgi:hypothetical protein